MAGDISLGPLDLFELSYPFILTFSCQKACIFLWCF